jgi:hypothetical protein
VDRLRTTVQYSKDVISGGILFALGLVYFVMALDLPPGRDEPGPSFFPIILGCSLMFVAVWIFAGGVRATPASTVDDELPRSFWKPAVAVGVTAAYVACLQPLGFALSTWLYTFCVAAMFK